MMTKANMKNELTIDSERGTLRRRGSLSSAAAGRPGQVRRTGTAGSTQQGEQFRTNPVKFFDTFLTVCNFYYKTNYTDTHHNVGKDFALHYGQNKVRTGIYKDDPPLMYSWLLRQFLKALMQTTTIQTTLFIPILEKDIATLDLFDYFYIQYLGYLNTYSRYYWQIYYTFTMIILTQSTHLQDMFMIPQLDGNDDGQAPASTSSWQIKGKKDSKGKAKNSGAGGSKREGGGGDGGQPPKRPKQTFVEKTREGFLVEFRSSVPGAPLVQEDFDHLERTILQHYLDIPEPTFAYRTINSGISQGGVWYACENQETADFLRNIVPGIDPPEGMGAYSYVLGNGELRYIKLKLPSKLWMSRDRLVKSLRLQNPSLQTYLDESGQRVQARFHVTAGLEPENEATARQQPYTYVTIEVHVNTVQAIVDLNGEVLIGNSRVRVTGAGIDQLIAERDNQAAQNLNNGA